MSDNIYRKATNTLELFSGRIADAYTKAQTDAKLGQITAQLQDKADTAFLADVATSGEYGDLIGKPSFANVATSGNYGDLNGKPTLGTAAAKNYITSLISGSGDLVTSGAVYASVIAASSVSIGAGYYVYKIGRLCILMGKGSYWFTGTVTIPAGYRPIIDTWIPVIEADSGTRITYGTLPTSGVISKQANYWGLIAGACWLTS